MEEKVSEEFLCLLKDSGLDELAKRFNQYFSEDDSPIVFESATESNKRKAVTSESSKRSKAKQSHHRVDNDVSQDKHGEGEEETTWSDTPKWLSRVSTSTMEKVRNKKVITLKELTEEIVEEMQGVPRNRFEEEKSAQLITERVKTTVSILVSMGMVTTSAGDRLEWRSAPSKESIRRETEMLKKEREAVAERIQAKYARLKDLILQSIALKNLLERNKANEQGMENDQKIPLPFIVVSTKKETVIECEMAENQADVFFNFNQPFQVHDDSQIIRGLNLHKTTMSSLKEFLPAELIPFVPQHVLIPEDNKEKEVADAQEAMESS